MFMFTLMLSIYFGYKYITYPNYPNLSIYVRLSYNNNCHALNACYVLHTSYIWFLVLTKHPWNQYHYLTLAFQQRGTVGFMWLVQVHPVVRHWGGIQTQTCWTPNTVLFFLQQHIDSSVGFLHINELMRHSGLQEGISNLIQHFLLISRNNHHL